MTHIYCENCNVVVPINYDAATEMAKHVNHVCKYTRIAT